MFYYWVITRPGHEVKKNKQKKLWDSQQGSTPSWTTTRDPQTRPNITIQKSASGAKILQMSEILTVRVAKSKSFQQSC